MSGKQITVKKAIKVFGFDPSTVGLRPRGWEVTEDGRLSICARDGGGNEPDMTAGRYPNYDGTECDDWDITYRYYYYKPLEALSNQQEPRSAKTPDATPNQGVDHHE